METTIVYWVYYWDNGKENGNYCSILGLYWDNEKENGNYCSILRNPWLRFWVVELATSTPKETGGVLKYVRS